MKFSRSETAAILAGLRLLQNAMRKEDELGDILPPDVYDALTDGGEIWPMDAEAIDNLCEKVGE